jgi:hypothetical protein
MNNESSRPDSKNDKSKDSFGYAAFMVGVIIVGTIIILLKLIGVF